jgi:MFS family permease
LVDQCLNDVSLINFRLEDITSDENKLQQNSAVLCIVSYLMIAFIPVPALGILGCAVCGLSVGIMWPGTFSMAAASVKRGGTALFALLALAGDVGCSSGPTYVGMISGALNDNLKLGIFAALIFPVLMIMGIKMIGSLRKYD